MMREKIEAAIIKAVGTDTMITAKAIADGVIAGLEAAGLLTLAPEATEEPAEPRIPHRIGQRPR
jgi:hypothetical protein